VIEIIAAIAKSTFEDQEFVPTYLRISTFVAITATSSSTTTATKFEFQWPMSILEQL
jgi:hypothetical protein